MSINEEKIERLKKKLIRYENKLKKKSLGYSEVVRTRYGDSYEDQLRDDTNLLRGIIQSIKEEIASLRK